ncbi:hypothetical protein RUM43_013204 [Polyplax serrata]|uniref:Uncharacterized protein n=1 Tax=Polyplax serrata TaxID=468196 RepID=A0AAN8RZ74_POLSC
MVPVMIGVQLVKSVLFAMFLPSLLGNLGRVVGEGVKFLSSQGYRSPTGADNMGQMEDFEFKDVNGYDQHYPDVQPDGSSSVYSYAYPAPFDYNKFPAGDTLQNTVASRFTTGAHKLNYIPNNNHHGSFYTKHNGKRQNFKVFHNIPSSSLLLTNYDPFYSPLLSRMDSVFKQLGYESETCRERLICLMYKNPAKFAPYSNLISAQLSRELNELRKPSTDNPDILRFFKYMKAAKDGQDGVECSREYPGCSNTKDSVSSPMVKTFNEINKLVQARKLS